MMGLFEIIYYLGYKAKTAYDLKRQRRLPARVISIGNITSGGTGKTPAAIAVAMEAKRRGLSPCVLTRGYKGRLRGPVRVTPDMKASDVGDEPLLMCRSLGDIPVVKGADRYASGIYALDHLDPKPDIFVLDDGFQHRKLYRDMDVLLVNSRNPFDNGKLLPVGLLREPLREIRRADVVVITKKADRNSVKLKEAIRGFNPGAPIFDAGYKLAAVVDASGERRPIEWLAGKDVYAFCGLGEPGSFRDSLLRAGARVRGFKPFSDHYRYSQSDIQKLSREAHMKGAPWIITTEKDIMRLGGIEAPENLLTLAIEFAVGEGLFEKLFK
jgi:tetraacyldisaccharide 4'-kinase